MWPARGFRGCNYMRKMAGSKSAITHISSSLWLLYLPALSISRSIPILLQCLSNNVQWIIVYVTKSYIIVFAIIFKIIEKRIIGIISIWFRISWSKRMYSRKEKKLLFILPHLFNSHIFWSIDSYFLFFFFQKIIVFR